MHPSPNSLKRKDTKMFLRLGDILERSDFFPNIPSKKEEKWRFSSLHQLLDREYDTTPSPAKEIDFIPEEEHWIHVRDGQLLKHTLPTNIHIRQHPISYEVKENPFACLAANEAPFPLELTCNEDVELVLYCDYSSNRFISSNINIKVKDNVTAKIYIRYEGGQKSFISHASHIQLQSYAKLHLSQSQNLETEAVFITQNSHHLQESSHLKSFSLLYGGEYLHNFLHIDLHYNSTAEVSSLLLAHKQQRQIFSCDIEHLSDCSTSRVLSKQVLNDNSTCVFDANTAIHPNTKMSEARQASRALLLDDSAQIHSKPHLEIYSDDLKASHGSTVGELDSEAIGYLISRGIPETKAREILISAFVYETIETIDEPDFKDRILSVMGDDYAQQSL